MIVFTGLGIATACWVAYLILAFMWERSHRWRDKWMPDLVWGKSHELQRFGTVTWRITLWGWRWRGYRVGVTRDEVKGRDFMGSPVRTFPR